MTFKLKEWISKVTEKMLLLMYINEIDKISIDANSSDTIYVENSEHVFIIGVGHGNSKILAIANATSSGAVSNLKAAGATNMTLTNGTNQLTINNGYGYAMDVLIIRF